VCAEEELLFFFLGSGEREREGEQVLLTWALDQCPQARDFIIQNLDYRIRILESPRIQTGPKYRCVR
jgi:hypothetical protein